MQSNDIFATGQMKVGKESWFWDSESLSRGGGWDQWFEGLSTQKLKDLRFGWEYIWYRCGERVFDKQRTCRKGKHYRRRYIEGTANQQQPKAKESHIGPGHQDSIRKTTVEKKSNYRTSHWVRRGSRLKSSQESRGNERELSKSKENRSIIES